MTNGDVNRKLECKCSLPKEMTKWVKGSQGRTNKTKIQECSLWVQANATIWYGSNHFQKGENFELPTCLLVHYACISIQRKRCLEIFIVVMSRRVFEILKQIIFMHLANSTNQLPNLPTHNWLV